LIKVALPKKCKVNDSSALFHISSMNNYFFLHGFLGTGRLELTLGLVTGNHFDSLMKMVKQVKRSHNLM